MVRQQPRKIAVGGIRDDGERCLFGIVSLKSRDGIGEIIGDFDDCINIAGGEKGSCLLRTGDQPVHGEIIRGDQLRNQGLARKNKVSSPASSVSVMSSSLLTNATGTRYRAFSPEERAPSSPPMMTSGVRSPAMIQRLRGERVFMQSPPLLAETSREWSWRR